MTGETTVAQLKGRITSEAPDGVQETRNQWNMTHQEAGIPYLCMKLLANNVELQEPSEIRQADTDDLESSRFLPSASCKCMCSSQDPVPLRHYDLAGQGLRVITTRRLYAGPAA